MVAMIILNLLEDVAELKMSPEEQTSSARKTSSQLMKDFGVSPKDLHPQLKLRFDQLGKAEKKHG